MEDAAKRTNITKVEKFMLLLVLAVLSGSLVLIGDMVLLDMMSGYHTMFGGHVILV